jgi:hypothetical protein
MSLTMMAMCWNHRSWLRESTGIGQLDLLLAEPHADHPHAQAEDPLEPLPVVAPHLHVRHRLEAEHPSVEVHRPLRARHGQADRAHGVDEGLRGPGGRRDQEEESGDGAGDDCPAHRSRPRR